MNKSININSTIKFKLTNEGEKILNKHDNDFKKLIFDDYNISHIFKRKIDENNFYSMQLWEAMSIFGEGCSLSKEPPFIDCKIFISDKDIKDIEFEI